MLECLIAMRLGQQAFMMLRGGLADGAMCASQICRDYSPGLWPPSLGYGGCLGTGGFMSFGGGGVGVEGEVWRHSLRTGIQVESNIDIEQRISRSGRGQEQEPHLSCCCKSNCRLPGSRAGVQGDNRLGDRQGVCINAQRLETQSFGVEHSRCSSASRESGAQPTSWWCGVVLNNGDEADVRCWRWDSGGDFRPMGDKKRRLLFDLFPVVVEVQVEAMKAFKATPALENEGNPAGCDPIDRGHVVHKKLIRSVQTALRSRGIHPTIH